MALRVMQIFVPRDGDSPLEDLLQGRDVLGSWRDEDNSRVVLHLLVPAEETEPIMDRFEEHYGSSKGFHVILFPVEAVLPRPEPVSGRNSEEDDAREDDAREDDSGESGEGESGEGEGESGEGDADEGDLWEGEAGEGDSRGDESDASSADSGGGEEAESDRDEEDASNGGHRVSREELYADVCEGLGVTRVFVGMAVLSALVASVGLVRDDVAVIIGAMVIAPLLAPNVAMSLAATLGDYGTLGRAFLTNLAGVSAAFAVAVVVGLVREIDPEISAIANRTQASVGDLVLALAAGCAGTLAFTSGLAGPVIGVMMAVALVPPLVVCGMLLGQGVYAAAWGAFLLTVANIVSINIAGVATFLAQGVRPRGWWEAERAKRSTLGVAIGWAVSLGILVLAIWLSQ